VDMPKRPQGVLVYTARTLPSLLTILTLLYYTSAVNFVLSFVHPIGKDGDEER